MEFTLKELIERRRIIDIDTAPNIDNVYTGICLLANGEVVLLLNFNEEYGDFDGFTIIKNQDFELYREWEDSEYTEVRNDNSKDLIAGIDSNDFQDMKAAFKTLTGKLVSVFTYEDEDSYWVGKVLVVNDNSVELQLISENAEWTDQQVFLFSDISYLGFDTRYEKNLVTAIDPFSPKNK